MAQALAVYAVTAALAAAVSLVLVRLRDRVRIVDVPNDRSSHKVPTPRTGGLALVAAVTAGFSLWSALVGRPAVAARLDAVIAATALAFFALGFADDLRRLSAAVKMPIQIAIAALAAGPGGLRVNVLDLPILGAVPMPPAAAIGLSMLWIVGFVNAFNFMDGIDGMAAGETAVVGLLLAAVGDPAWGLVLSASALGFLALNWQPARLFMGDGGSYLLGSLLATSVIAGSGGGARVPLPVFVLFLGTFLADSTVTWARRVINREPWLQPHRSHFYQRLVQAGLSHRAVSSLNIAVAVALGATGITYAASPWAWQAAILIGAGVVAGIGLTWVGKLERGQPLVTPKSLFVIVSDLAMVTAAYAFAYLLRFDFQIDPLYLPRLLKSLPYVVTAYFVASNLFGLYKGVYRYSSFADLRRITAAVATAGSAVAATVMMTFQGYFPRSVLILHPLLSFLGICAVRFGIRLMKGSTREVRAGARTAVVVGTGDLAENLLRRLLPVATYDIVGLVDDDPAKWGLRMHGRPILGGTKALPAFLARRPVDEVLIAVESRRGEVVREVAEAIRDLPRKPELKIAPNLAETLRALGQASAVRRVSPADLLNREVVRLDEARIEQAVAGKTVLVSGAGGTIGGELCRQVLRYSPAKLILLENHANSLFFQEGELRESPRGVEIISVLADVRDEAALERLFAAHRPHLVLHAAAHKHVYQLEYNVPEGITNNVLGTLRLASAADRHGAETFLLISTDKAVRPASVMGATKRAAEVVMQHMAERSSTRFIAVRFGNVVGSSGSVLRIFEQQIAKGGPITITDPRATRYFMTVEEAVGLILQAVSMARGGEIFVLKMGTPVRIADMAANLLLLSGLEPGKDIEIRITGLKPGEKLDEELVEAGSEAVESPHPDILILRSTGGAPDDFERSVKALETAARGSDPEAMLRTLGEIATTFRQADAVSPPE